MVPNESIATRKITLSGWLHCPFYNLNVLLFRLAAAIIIVDTQN